MTGESRQHRDVLYRLEHWKPFREEEYYVARLSPLAFAQFSDKYNQDYCTIEIKGRFKNTVIQQTKQLIDDMLAGQASK